MPSIGHIAVGLAASRHWPGSRVFGAALCVGFAMLPDLDVLAFNLGIPYGDPFGHRGAAHSTLVAVAVGLAAGLLVRLGRGSAMRVGVLVTACLASHGLLDAMTAGGKGIALFWPLSDERIFLPWRPIPVAPLGPAYFTERGLAVAGRELLYFLPLFVYGLLPRDSWGAAEAPCSSRK